MAIDFRLWVGYDRLYGLELGGCRCMDMQKAGESIWMQRQRRKAAAAYKGEHI
jgi:hypothetical protein